MAQREGLDFAQRRRGAESYLVLVRRAFAAAAKLTQGSAI